MRWFQDLSEDEKQGQPANQQGEGKWLAQGEDEVSSTSGIKPLAPHDFALRRGPRVNGLFVIALQDETVPTVATYDAVDHYAFVGAIGDNLTDLVSIPLTCDHEVTRIQVRFHAMPGDDKIACRSSEEAWTERERPRHEY